MRRDAFDAAPLSSATIDAVAPKARSLDQRVAQRIGVKSEMMARFTPGPLPIRRRASLRQLFAPNTKLRDKVSRTP